MSDNEMVGETLLQSTRELQERVNARQIASRLGGSHLSERRPPEPSLSLRRKRRALSSLAPPLYPPLSSGGHTLPRTGRERGGGGREEGAACQLSGRLCFGSELCLAIIRLSQKKWSEESAFSRN